VPVYGKRKLIMLERTRRVVLLIDYDNLQICASRDTPGRELQLTPVVQLAQKYGTVILARAYAEWNLSTERLAVYKAGIEPAFAPVLRTESDRSGKSLADTVMVAEGMDMLWTLSPDVVVLATSDKDLIPLVRVAKQRGSFVVVLGSDFTAVPLREMADEHVTYKQLITDASGRYTSDAAPTRQPAAVPEPLRRRSRERNGREARGGVPGATPPTVAQPPARHERETPPTPTPAVVSAEPVAPVTSGTPGETDGQIANRRRRRRGSRRRSDRLGFGSDVPGTADAEAENDDGLEAGEAEDGTALVDVAQASGGTQEAPVSSFDAGIAPPPEETQEPDAEAEAEAEAEAAQGSVEQAVQPGTTLAAAPAPDEPMTEESAPELALAEAGEPGAPVAPPPPVRDRRRRSRRAAATAETPTADGQPVTPTTPAPETAAEAPSDGDGSVGLQATRPEALELETPAAPMPTDPEAEAEAGESGAPLPPARRRRVASAARARTRRAT
jgi:uncharacterized LabA/DUF88 family protein